MRYVVAAVAMMMTSSLWASSDCLVVGHRGASAYVPEHTAEAYRLAIKQGADYIEPDVVLTKDGVPVVRHEAELSLTTDVADRPEFADRRSSRTAYGQTIEGWFVDDFTLAEIKTLRATERWPELRPVSAAQNGRYSVLTLREAIAVAQNAEREVGLYIEFKSDAYFRERGQDVVGAVLSELAQAGLNTADAPVYLQSFEPPALQRARAATPLPLVQLLYTTEGLNLELIARYAQGVGVSKQGFEAYYQQARELGMEVHAYTFRGEEKFLTAPSLEEEINRHLDAGLTGFFTDNPDVGRVVCDKR